jgi:hypothetical protein
LALARADEARDVAARQLAAVEERLKNAAGLRRKATKVRFFVGPAKDARSELVRLPQAFHELDLIDAGFQEVAREVCEALLAQIAAVIKIVPPLKIGDRYPASESKLVGGR